MLALLLARQRLLRRRPAAAPWWSSNSGGGLPLLEVMSRHTAQELTAAGYRTTLLTGKGVEPGPIRKALPSADLFIWEGHYKTLTEEFGFGDWTEPLPPLLFLQTCLALNEKETAPLLTRGAVGAGRQLLACLFRHRRGLHAGVLRRGPVRRPEPGRVAAPGEELPARLLAAQAERG